jgi:hypothetical protein
MSAISALRGLKFRGQSELHRKTLSQKTQKEQIKNLFLDWRLKW